MTNLLKRIARAGQTLGYVIGNKGFFVVEGGCEAPSHGHACAYILAVFPGAKLEPMAEDEIRRLLFPVGPGCSEPVLKGEKTHVGD